MATDFTTDWSFQSWGLDMGEFRRRRAFQIVRKTTVVSKFAFSSSCEVRTNGCRCLASGGWSTLTWRAYGKLSTSRLKCGYETRWNLPSFLLMFSTLWLDLRSECKSFDYRRDCFYWHSVLNTKICLWKISTIMT